MKTPRSKPFPQFTPFWSVALTLAAYLLLRQFPDADLLIQVPLEHFYIVSAASALTAIVAVAMGFIGLRLRNQQVIFVSLAYTSLAILFTLHGLSTPGMMLPFTRVVGIAAILSIAVMSVWLWLSSLPGDHPAVKPFARFGGRLLPGWTLLLLALSVWAFKVPDIVAWVPVDLEPFKWGVTAVTLFFALASSVRYWRSFRYSKFPFQAAVAHAAGLVAVSEVIMISGEVWRASWWLYHVYLLVSAVLSVSGLVQQYKRDETLALAVTGLFTLDLTERLEAGISPSVRALVAATEARDRYTAGHSRRVAQAALAFGSHLGLKPEELRALAQGCVLHDIGKLDIPDDVLNKPGALTAEERFEIERHTVRGFQICRQLGFMQEELDIIRHHHERYDGMGYPDAKLGEEIPKLARMIAIVDVFDALTSERSYRPAWGQENAIAYVRENRGQQFDPHFVDAWLEMIAAR